VLKRLDLADALRPSLRHSRASDGQLDRNRLSRAQREVLRAGSAAVLPPLRGWFPELLNPFIEGGGDGQHGRFAYFAFEFLQFSPATGSFHLGSRDEARFLQQPRVVKAQFVVQF